MLLLTGSEPLLRQDFEEIYLGIKKMGVPVSVNTNGLPIDDKKVKFFADNPPQKLNITLYAASEQTYSELCGNGKAYQKVVDAINKLADAGVYVKLNYTVTQYNKDDAAQIYEFARRQPQNAFRLYSQPSTILKLFQDIAFLRTSAFTRHQFSLQALI